MLRALSLILFLAVLAGCSPKIRMRSATQDDFKLLPRSTDNAAPYSRCYDPSVYVSNPALMPIRYIRVNFHFMNSTDGKYNMPEADVYAYAKDWLDAANYNLERNTKMFLPHGNNTPVLPIPYRYVLTPDPDVPGDKGVYYHVDDALCYAVKTGRERNISDKRVITKYAVHPDSVLNIFVQTHQLDSIPSKTYKADISGISLGSSVKIFGRWFNKPSVW
ncbi:MAG TPA: hypothetical protein VJ508_10910, partial [Saprospiraceae bacterium]|nr:hypothetical protein [Saprospiraceae bacterium]